MGAAATARPGVERGGPPGEGPSLQRAWVLFVVRFALVFLVGTGLHQATRDSTAPLLVGLLSARTASALIHAITPSDSPVVAAGRIDGQASIVVGQGCDGIDSLLLLAAAVVAFPAPWRRKLAGLAGGVALLYACNLARIVALYEVQRLRPRSFAFAHEYVGQTVIILVGFGFFLAWSGALARQEPT